MSRPRSADPAGLGRGPLTRRLPVLLPAPAEPPEARPFETGAGDTPGRFLARVIFSLPRVTVPAMLLAVVWQVGESAVPVVMGLAIDRALATGDAGQLVLWIGVLVGVYTALTVAARFANRLGAHALQLFQHRLRVTLSTRVLHPVDEGAGRSPDGDVVSVMTNDVARLANAGLLVVLPVARIAAIGFVGASLLATHWLLGVVVLVGAPVVVWLMGVLSERLSRDTREYQRLLAATVGRATDLVAGYRVIKGVRAEAEATRRYRRASQETLVGARRNAGLLGRFLVTSGVVSGVFVAAVTGLAGWFAVDGQLTIGGLITAVGLTQALLPQMQAIASASIPNLASARASSARILDVLRGGCGGGPGGGGGVRAGDAVVPAAAGRGGAGVEAGVLDGGVPDGGGLDAGGLDGGVSDGGGLDAGGLDGGVSDVGMIHGGVPDAGGLDGGVLDAGVLDGGVPEAGGLDGGGLETGVPEAGVLGVSVSGATVRVRPGELVGVRADDRTAARIADALLNPRAGNGIEVRLDGRPVRELTPAEYRSRITVAPHRATLFTGTIRENLTTPTITLDRLDAAMRAAACEDFAVDLDAPVGENGNRLSGGQRQRVALARALATDAPLLVLHDPTTAVDSVTEHTIAGRLPGFRAGRSTVLIASSPALLGCCDRVVDLLGDEPLRDSTVLDGSVAQ